jgi:serine protease AprX
VTVENIPNTDESVGHGTHCAGIIGGMGTRSGGAYAGVAPGSKIIGAGLGAGILVINPLGAWEWGLANQFRYNIRVTSNSYGPLGGGEFNPDHPITIASRLAYERNITSVFAAGNDGSSKNTMSPYAKAPWVIGVAAGTKEGTLVDFSSRGTPRAERLNDADPLNDNDAPTITAPGTGRAFETSVTRFGFTSAMVSTRAISNLTSNGLDADTELAPGLIPFYTQISGTSMATPFIAGTIALMLDADPTLTPDEIKQIITETATKMPGYEDYQVGAGYVNSFAAVDKVFNRSKGYANFQNTTFNAVFGEERPATQNFHIAFNPAVSGTTSTNATTFTVEEGMSVLDVSAEVDTDAEEGTGNLVGLRLTAPNGTGYSTAIDFPVIGSNKREIIVPNPIPGTWTLEVKGARGLTAAPQASSPVQAAAPGPVDGSVVQIKYILPNIADIQGNENQAAIEFALKNRLIDTYADGTFRPTQTVTREDLARSLVLNTSLRQSLGGTPKFADVTGDLRNIAEAVTAKGSTNRGYDFTATGLMSFTGTSRHRRVEKETLIEAFWGDAELDAIEKNFHPTISHVRKALNSRQTLKQNFLLYRDGSYQLNPELTYSIDTEEFSYFVAEAEKAFRDKENDRLWENIEAAHRLYRGDFMAGVYEDWAEELRGFFREQHARILKSMAKFAFREKSWTKALGFASEILREDPFREDIHALIMRVYAAQNKRSAAKEQYHKLQKLLKEELGVEPAPETRRVYQELLK